MELLKSILLGVVSFLLVLTTYQLNNLGKQRDYYKQLFAGLRCVDNKFEYDPGLASFFEEKYRGKHISPTNIEVKIPATLN